MEGKRGRGSLERNIEIKGKLYIKMKTKQYKINA